ncbi:MAG: hypothetical protein K0R51_3234 [Cytophagaceae bacterium]|jgi:hypothetical protein|nr:hypothetical protein [Cytophagaceae bacterium]
MDDLLSKINALEKTDSWNDEHVYSFIFKGIADLLMRDVQLLFQLLYRIDVKESLVKEVFQQAEEPDEIANRLTALIIARLKQKIEIRRRYSS